jgi:hypothetical protein
MRQRRDYWIGVRGLWSDSVPLSRHIGTGRSGLNQPSIPWIAKVRVSVQSTGSIGQKSKMQGWPPSVDYS